MSKKKKISFPSAWKQTLLWVLKEQQKLSSLCYFKNTWYLIGSYLLELEKGADTLILFMFYFYSYKKEKSAAQFSVREQWKGY